MIKLGLIYGGMSTEHDISIKSAKSIIDNLNKSKYDLFEIIIDKNGNWYDKEGKKIENITKILQDLDVVFPVLHGLYGEDGTIQGMLELLKVPYVGTGILSSANCMDKAYSKIIFEKAKIPQAKYVYIKKVEGNYIFVTKNFDEISGNTREICNLIIKEIDFPMFVKPSNSGSSVGISKVTNMDELIGAVEYASNFDKKILVEENIDGQEIECAVLGNENPKASAVGEILSAEDFYSFDAKYNNSDSKTQIPANISKEKQEEIRTLAIKAYKALDCRGLSRVDFFIERGTGKIYINEINTMPGFTKISMYPKLWEYSGIKYSDLLDELIDLALKK